MSGIGVPAGSRWKVPPCTGTTSSVGDGSSFSSASLRPGPSGMSSSEQSPVRRRSASMSRVDMPALPHRAASWAASVVLPSPPTALVISTHRPFSSSAGLPQTANRRWSSRWMNCSIWSSRRPVSVRLRNDRAVGSGGRA